MNEIHETMLYPSPLGRWCAGMNRPRYHAAPHLWRHNECKGETRIAPELRAARDQKERTRIVRRLMSIIGFTSLGYVTMQPSDEYTTWAGSHHAETLKLFGDLLLETPHLARAPRLEVVLHTNSPLVWDRHWLRKSWPRGGSDDTMRRLLNGLDGRNVHSGLMFSVAVMPTRARAVISFDASNANLEWINDNVIIQALTLGLSLRRIASEPLHARLGHQGP